MANNNDSIKKTITVIVLLCLVCSLVVSLSAVGLKKRQELNKVLDTQKNILRAASIEFTNADIQEKYNNQIEAKVVDLHAGEFASHIDANTYSQRDAAKDPAQSIALNPEDDVAGIRTRANFANIYLAKDEAGIIKTLIIPIHSYGLWSVMYAFVALDVNDFSIQKLVYYDHGETPGLGGEIANPAWNVLWVGKKLFDENEDMAIEIVKGGANPNSGRFAHQIDGIAGATLTVNGVQYGFDFWFGELGFEKFIDNLKQSGGLTNE